MVILTEMDNIPHITLTYGAFKHGEPFLLSFCEKNLTSSVLMKKINSGVNIIKHMFGELVYAFLEQK